MNLKRLWKQDTTRRQALASGQVVPNPMRCVHCDICSFSCPIEIDVRRYAWNGVPVKDNYCLTCAECVERCPRGALRFEQIDLVSA